MAQAASTLQKPSGMTPAKGFALWMMMFFQYAAWGSWAATLGKFIPDARPMGLETKEWIGPVFALLPLSTLFMPMVMAQLADRVINAERILGFLHIIAAAMMFFIAEQTEVRPFFIGMAIYTLIYSPTLTLSTSIVFSHLADRADRFTLYRVGGTVGWAVAGLALSFWRAQAGGSPVYGDLFRLSMGFSIVAGVIGFLMPIAAPVSKPKNPLALAEAFKLLTKPAFLVFTLISFVVASQVEFYYAHTASYLGTPKQFGGLGISDKQIPALMSIGQITEFAMMLWLPWLIKRFGVRPLLAIGALAWPIRYALFAFVPNLSAVIPALAMHGICFVCFFVVGNIYVNTTAPSDIKASAQALYSMFVMGIGRLLGSVFAGWVQNKNAYPLSAPEMVNNVYIRSSVNWKPVFALPCVLTVTCAILFLVLFKPDETKKSPGV